MLVFDAINEDLSIWEIKEQIDKTILDIPVEKNEQDETAFIFACKHKKLKWVDFLLSLGADPKDVNSSRQNALHLLIDKDIPIAALTTLIELGADPNHQDQDGQSALFYALKHQRQDITHLLLSEDANPDLVDKNGNSPLLLAALSGNTGCVDLLIESGVNTNACNLRGQNALHLAAVSGEEEIVKKLLESGIPINTKDVWGRTALHYAAVQENSEITKVLVKAGLDPNALDLEGSSALILASVQGLPNQVEELIKVGGDPHSADKNNETTIVKALKQNPSSFRQVLAAEKIEIDPTAKIKGVTDDLSFLHEVIRIKGSSHQENISDHFMVSSTAPSMFDRYAEVAELLLNTGIPFDLKTEAKNRPGLLEEVKKNTAMLKTLMNHEKRKALGQLNVPEPKTPIAILEPRLKDNIPKKAEKAKEQDAPLDPNNIPLNSRDPKGIPHLIAFAANGKHETVELMLKQGNDWKIRDKFGRTALMVAAQFGHVETIKVILKYDKDLNYKTARGENALLMAIMENQVEAAALLLKGGANPDTRYKGAYFLHLVAGNGGIELAKIMLKLGANPQVKDIKGRTPAFYAKAKGLIELEAILSDFKENG